MELGTDIGEILVDERENGRGTERRGGLVYYCSLMIRTPRATDPEILPIELLLCFSPRILSQRQPRNMTCLCEEVLFDVRFPFKLVVKEYESKCYDILHSRF